MRTQAVLAVAVAALACLGVTHAIKCYSCVWATDSNAELIIDGVLAPKQDEKCADSFDEKSLSSSERPNTVNIPFPIAFGSSATLSTGNGTAINGFNELFAGSKGSGVKAGAPYKVYCAKLTRKLAGFGDVTVRGFVAMDDIPQNECQSNNDATGCTCDTNECNSASGLQMSLGFVAVAFLSKFFF